MKIQVRDSNNVVVELSIFNALVLIENLVDAIKDAYNVGNGSVRFGVPVQLVKGHKEKQCNPGSVTVRITP